MLDRGKVHFYLTNLSLSLPPISCGGFLLSDCNYTNYVSLKLISKSLELKMIVKRDEFHSYVSDE